MRILFIAPRIPFPAVKGDQLRAYNQLKGLKKLGHELHLISFSNEDSVPEEIQSLCTKVFPVKFEKLKAYKNIAAGMFNRIPIQVAYYESEGFRKTIQQAIGTEEYDVVHTQLVRTYPYIDELKSVPNVIDFVDSISLNLSRRAAFKKSAFNPVIQYEASLIRRMEKEAVHSFDGSIFISDVDRDNVGEKGKGIATISNGVDMEFFQYRSELTEENNLVFVGNMAYEPNRHGVKHFIENIYPLMMKKKADFTLYIVGRNPTPDLLALCKDKKNIVVTGEVDDIRDYLGRSRLFVCPLQTGAGVQNKVLEAMSAGVPVLTRSIVNDPIGAIDGESVVVRDEDQAFADAAIELLEDNEKLEALRTSARTFMEEQYDWDALNKKLEHFYRETVYRRTNVFADLRS